MNEVHLARFKLLFYAGVVRSRFHFGVQNMQRLTARFLLLFAIAGNFVPLALAAATSPTHACCIRKAVHKCHEAALAGSAQSSSQPLVHAAGSCNHDCCRGATTAQWASPQFPGSGAVAHEANGTVAATQLSTPSTEAFLLQSSRAPPAR
jgi:hypothetical protein